jgi:formyltetrahydrofolate-dependent phosphoribosylglycinamide formyltransferase
MDAIDEGVIRDARIALVISSSSKAYALERAEKTGIKQRVISGKILPDGAERSGDFSEAHDESERSGILIEPDESERTRALMEAHDGAERTSVLNEPDESKRTRALMDALDEAETDVILLAGYMKILPREIVQRYRNRIINIHPSLIPKHCGTGYYGIRVHQSVIDSGDKRSGATVHYVDEGVDTGRIILQKEVPVLPGDTAEDLAARVLETEHKIIVEGLNLHLKSMGEYGKMTRKI